MRMLIGTVLVLAVAGAAPGQEKATPGQPVETEPDELVLAGPKVETARLPGLEESFSGGAMRMPGMSERPVPMQVYRRAFEMLLAESVDEQHRLTDEQEAKLRELASQHGQAVREHMQTYSDEIARLRRAAGSRDAPRDTDAQPRRGGQDATSVLQRRLAQIRRSGPSDASLQTQMWAVLTEPQRELVEAQIDAWREEMSERRTQQVMERYMRQSRDAARDTPPSRSDRARVTDAGPFERQLSERLRRSIRRLPPEARAKLLERLRRRWEQQRRDAPAEGANPRSSRSADPPRSGG